MTTSEEILEQAELNKQRTGKFIRPHIDHDPVEPWVWATLIGHADPVEVTSFPIPAEGDGGKITVRATIMVRMKVGEPGTIKEVPLLWIACFSPSRHEWSNRPKKFYDPSNPTAFIFTDEE